MLESHSYTPYLPVHIVWSNHCLGLSHHVRFTPDDKATMSVLCAQVSLYLLLLEERYGHQLDMGLLWYLNDQARRVIYCLSRARLYACQCRI